MISHHPEDTLIFDYAAGSAPEPLALVIATHLEFCPACRDRLAAIESAGGALLETLAPARVSDEAFEATLARIAATANDDLPVGHAAAGDGAGIPAALRRYLPGPVEALPFRRFGGVGYFEIRTGRPGFRTRLVRMSPGRSAQRHTHAGNEYCAVLTGGFSDSAGHYVAGDFCAADRDLDHRPVADPGEPCIALMVHDAPIRLTGAFGRLLNPLVR